MKKIAMSLMTAALIAAPAAWAACDNCGTVTDLKTVEVKGEGSGVGAVAGGVLGGVLGHQVGGGRGKDVATVAGAVGGAYAGHQVEKNVKKKTQYQVVVKMENGSSRTFTYGAATAFKVGDKIKVVNNKLVRD
ncbi:MAG TPA: glycine zipper 2TM domain-containing protein [Usitatibacteraceae bacterium]|nr:glycine zipper 2TM domain-containing protein [Usitatibacteraceae bacterium]